MHVAFLLDDPQVHGLSSTVRLRAFVISNIPPRLLGLLKAVDLFLGAFFLTLRESDSSVAQKPLYPFGK